MKFLILLAAAFAAYTIWRQSRPVRRGGWRVGAGLGATVLVVVGAVMAIKGEPWVGLPLVAGGLVLAFGGRVYRGGRGKPSAPNKEPMSLADARSILGVAPGASAQEVKAAYQRLMKRNHPDQGGTSGLASQLNAARDRLLKEG